VLCLRVVALVTLLSVIVMVICGGVLDGRLYTLAWVLSVFMVAVLFCSFFRFDRMQSRYVYRYSDVSDLRSFNGGTMTKGPERSSSGTGLMHGKLQAPSYVPPSMIRANVTHNKSAHAMNTNGEGRVEVPDRDSGVYTTSYTGTRSELHRSVQEMLVPEQV